ncbi:hypothetical protein NADRNF5_1387 [Nitrosopumilus adriaticus]|uniref:Uncharacterized protein n=1 Tax=Nitrosopumilus adriaticus TaxID=1580092 RepID=A0A0D5C3U2_9ARCH|nr:hypothetical protein NADRNF5_1387 [Nitrosopumilus adriaticus]
MASLSRLQKLQYSSDEFLLIGVRQSWQYFILVKAQSSILGNNF